MPCKNQKHVRVSWQRQSDAAGICSACVVSAIATRLQASTSRVTSPPPLIPLIQTLPSLPLPLTLFAHKARCSYAHSLACSLAYLLLPLPNPFCVSCRRRNLTKSHVSRCRCRSQRSSTLLLLQPLSAQHQLLCSYTLTLSVYARSLTAPPALATAAAASAAASASALPRHLVNFALASASAIGILRPRPTSSAFATSASQQLCALFAASVSI